MAAYFERRRFMRFKTVLDEMRMQDVVGSLRQIGDDVKKENGVSIAQCEFWSDTLDRWAEDLVDPAKGGTCNAKSRSSLPPALVLEALQILEAEVNLREETRVTEQAKSATAAEKHKEQARQALRRRRTAWASASTSSSEKIRELPDADTEFAYEMALLGRVSEVMGEATEILAQSGDGQPGHRRRDRGHRAVAAIQADQPQGRRRRRLDPGRRRTRHDPRLGPGPARRRRQREGSP